MKPHRQQDVGESKGRNTASEEPSEAHPYKEAVLEASIKGCVNQKWYKSWILSKKLSSTVDTYLNILLL